MKKNILIIILLFTTAFSMVYAFIKADEAEKAMMAAETAQREALAEKERADAQATLAMQAATEARMVQAEAERALQECQSK